MVPVNGNKTTTAFRHVVLKAGGRPSHVKAAGTLVKSVHGTLSNGKDLLRSRVVSHSPFSSFLLSPSSQLNVAMNYSQNVYPERSFRFK